MLAPSVRRVDAGQQGLQRRGAIGIELGFVHAGAIDVADLLFDRARRGLGGGGRFGDLLLGRERAFLQHFEAAPGGLVGRHRVRGQPFAVDVGIQVVADQGIGVEVGGAEGRQRRQLGDIDAQRRCGGRGGGRGRRGFFLLAGGQRGGDGQGQRQVFEVVYGHGKSSRAPQGAVLAFGRKIGQASEGMPRAGVGRWAKGHGVGEPRQWLRAFPGERMGFARPLGQPVAGEVGRDMFSTVGSRLPCA